jgi:copper(I)-binding protein
MRQRDRRIGTLRSSIITYRHPTRLIHKSSSARGEIDTVIRNSRRVAAVAIAGALAAVPAVSACGAGEEPQSAAPTQLTEGVNVTTPNGVAVRNLFILGPLPGQRLPAGSAATVYASMVNNSTDQQPDRLIAVTAPGAAQTGQIQTGAVNLPYQQLVRLGTSSAGMTLPVVTLQALTAQLAGGESIKLVLQFERAGTLQATVPVVPREGNYATYAPAPNPTPSASPRATRTGGASTGQSGAASASPSP